MWQINFIERRYSMLSIQKETMFQAIGNAKSWTEAWQVVQRNIGKILIIIALLLILTLGPSVLIVWSIGILLGTTSFWSWFVLVTIFYFVTAWWLGIAWIILVLCKIISPLMARWLE